MASLDENDLVLGISVMLQSLNERLKFHLKNEGPSEIPAPAEETLTLAPGLAKAARLRIGTGGGANEALYGTWTKTECRIVQGAESIRTYYVFSEKGGAVKVAFFLGTDTCAGFPAAIQTIELSQFKVGNAVPEPEFVESRPGFVPMMELDVTFGRTFETVLTQTGADSANNARSCGYSDWQIGVPKDITNSTFPTFDGSFTAPAVGQLGRTVFKLVEMIRKERRFTGLREHSLTRGLSRLRCR